MSSSILPLSFSHTGAAAAVGNKILLLTFVLKLFNLIYLTFPHIKLNVFWHLTTYLANPVLRPRPFFLLHASWLNRLIKPSSQKKKEEEGKNIGLGRKEENTKNPLGKNSGVAALVTFLEGTISREGGAVQIWIFSIEGARATAVLPKERKEKAPFPLPLRSLGVSWLNWCLENGEEKEEGKHGLCMFWQEARVLGGRITTGWFGREEMISSQQSGFLHFHLFLRLDLFPRGNVFCCKHCFWRHTFFLLGRFSPSSSVCPDCRVNGPQLTDWDKNKLYLNLKFVTSSFFHSLSMYFHGNKLPVWWFPRLSFSPFSTSSLFSNKIYCNKKRRRRRRKNGSTKKRLPSLRSIHSLSFSSKPVTCSHFPNRLYGQTTHTFFLSHIVTFPFFLFFRGNLSPQQQSTKKTTDSHSFPMFGAKKKKEENSSSQFSPLFPSPSPLNFSQKE